MWKWFCMGWEVCEVRAVENVAILVDVVLGNQSHCDQTVVRGG